MIKIRGGAIKLKIQQQHQLDKDSSGVMTLSIQWEVAFLCLLPTMINALLQYSFHGYESVYLKIAFSSVGVHNMHALNATCIQSLYFNPSEGRMPLALMILLGGKIQIIFVVYLVGSLTVNGISIGCACVSVSFMLCFLNSDQHNNLWWIVLAQC